MARPSVLIGSHNAAVGMDRGIAILSAGGSALDAVEAVIRAVEDNPDDHTVGFSGYPNADGVVELDAAIMDGTSRQAGAVGALRDYRAAITVARAVMERTDHVLITGDGAARLAAQIGLQPESLLTEHTEQVWRDRLPLELPVDPGRVATADDSYGTVVVLAVDRRARVVSGVSTSGWAWKHPGRLGDSPVIGAGSYADSRVGAAACTGWGELAVRAGTARMVVAAMDRGHSAQEAARLALDDVRALERGDRPLAMHVVVLAADGTHAALSTERDYRYVHWTEGEPDFTSTAQVLVT